MSLIYRNSAAGIQTAILTFEDRMPDLALDVTTRSVRYLTPLPIRDNVEP